MEDTADPSGAHLASLRRLIDEASLNPPRSPGDASGLDPAEVDDLLEVATDLIAVTSFDGYFLVLSHSWQLALGWSLEELRSVPFIHFVHPGDLDPTAVTTERMQGTSRLLSFVNRYLCKDGTYKRLEWRGKVDLERARYYTSSVDYTPILRARAVRAELRTLANLCGGAVVSEDGEGRIQRWAGPSTELFGWTAAQVSSRHTHELLSLPSGAPTSLSELANSEESDDGPVAALVLTASGTWRPVWVAADFFQGGASLESDVVAVLTPREGDAP